MTSSITGCSFSFTTRAATSQIHGFSGGAPPLNLTYTRKGNKKKTLGYCDSPGKCAQSGVTPYVPFTDQMKVTAANPVNIQKRFQIDGHPARIYDPKSKSGYSYVNV